MQESARFLKDSKSRSESADCKYNKKQRSCDEDEEEERKTILHKSEISLFEPEIDDIEYCKESILKKWTLAPFLIIISFGSLYFLSYIYTRVNMLLYYTKVDKHNSTDSLQITDATHCKITGGWSNNKNPNKADIIELKKIPPPMKEAYIKDSFKRNELLYDEYILIYKYTTYVYDHEEGVFNLLKFNYHQQFKKLRSIFIGVKESDHQRQLLRYGMCLIDLKVKPVYRILFEDVFNWFYLFQIAALVVWMTDIYFSYDIAIMIMLFFSLYGETKDIYDNLYQLREMAKYECDIKVRRIDSNGDKKWININSSEIVPGDIFEVPESKKLPCDALMLCGQCVVNESMLTGESTPAVKFSMPKTDELCKDFNIENKEQVKYFLFSGTEVVQSKASSEGCLALAIKTGFDSEKGQLVRSLLFPEPDRFNFALQINYYLIITISIALIGLCSVFWVLVEYYSVWNILLKSLEILFMAVPPELPVIISMGLIFSMQKLKDNSIYCINSQKIRTAGLVSIMVFDKTGTLTEDGLSVDGSCILHQGKFSQKIPPTERPFSIDQVWKDKDEYLKYRSDAFLKYWECMACCHSLTKFHDKFIGDSLDVQMLLSSQWNLNISCSDFEKESNKDFHEFQPNLVCQLSGQKELFYNLNVVCIFDFSSELQRMSVIAKANYDNKYICFVKGSPEKIDELSVKGTIPKDYYQVLREHTQKGKRVIALSYKFLDSFDEDNKDYYKRNQFEHSVIFLGFLVLSNKLKEPTTRSIEALKEGCVVSVMATGDNTDTGIAVARECGIVTKNEILIANLEKFSTVLTFEKVSESPTTHSVEHKEIDYIESENNQDYSSDDELSPKDPELNNLVKGDILREFMTRDPNEFEFACNGKALQHIVMLANKNQKYMEYDAKEILEKIIKTGKVFARMSPNAKAMLVEEIQKQTGKLVGMCGDGANDCTALKKADVGLSLSEAEASCVAPFTSKISDISNLVKLLIIGRACLELCYELLKYIICYITIQFTSNLILYYTTSSLSDIQLLYIDLGAVMPVTILLCWTNTSDVLIGRLPVGSALDRSIIIALFGSCFIQQACTIGIYFCLLGQGFYNEHDRSGTSEVQDAEATTVFLFTFPQYIFAALTFHLSAKFRKPFYTNKAFLIFLLVQFAITYWIILLPVHFMKDIFKQAHLDFYFRVTIAGASVCNGILCILLELACSRIFVYKDFVQKIETDSK